MDFEPTYTNEQEEFRLEVREWLKQNVPLRHCPSSGLWGPDLRTVPVAP